MQESTFKLLESTEQKQGTAHLFEFHSVSGSRFAGPDVVEFQSQICSSLGSAERHCTCKD